MGFGKIVFVLVVLLIAAQIYFFDALTLEYGVYGLAPALAAIIIGWFGWWVTRGRYPQLAYA